MVIWTCIDYIKLQFEQDDVGPAYNSEKLNMKIVMQDLKFFTYFYDVDDTRHVCGSEIEVNLNIFMKDLD